MSSSPISRFYQELKRRKVIRVAIVYVLVAWVVVEVASVMFPGLLLPDWSVRLVIGLAVIGFPIALVMAWALELSPDGLRMDSETKTDSEAGKKADDKALAEPDPKPAKEGFDSIAVLPFLIELAD